MAALRSVGEEVVDLLAELLGRKPSAVVAEAHVVHDLGADSLDLVEIVMSVEERFGIEVPDVDAEQVFAVGTVQALVDYVTAHGGTVRPAPKLGW